MKALVTGSRDWHHRHAMVIVLDDVRPTVVVDGGQTGADTIARSVASQLGIDVVTYWANWNLHGKAAGPIRNQRMLLEQKPDVVLAFPMPHSRGTWDMVDRAKAHGVPVRIFNEAGVEIADPREKVTA